MTDSRLAQAIYNNAIWCDAVCRAHGAPRHREQLWLNPRPSPPFYPNLVTLAGAEGTEAQLAAIRVRRTASSH